MMQTAMFYLGCAVAVAASVMALCGLIYAASIVVYKTARQRYAVAYILAAIRERKKTHPVPKWLDPDREPQEGET